MLPSFRKIFAKIIKRCSSDLFRIVWKLISKEIIVAVKNIIYLSTAILVSLLFNAKKSYKWEQKKSGI
jgi:hypothetical protein